MASSADDSNELDRLADAVVPSFRRKPSLPPPAEAAAALESAPAAVSVKLENPDIPLAPRVPAIDPSLGGHVEVAPQAGAAHADRGDATPIDLPQVVLPVVSSTSPSLTQADPHEAATVPPPKPSTKPKKQLRSVPEPSVKAEAQLHTPSPRVAVRDEAPKIVFNDPPAPARLPTMPMSAVRITGIDATRVTLRPPKKAKAAPLVPALLAAIAILGIAALLLKNREPSDSAARRPSPAPAVAPAEPSVRASDETDRQVPPPPPEEDITETLPANAPPPRVAEPSAARPASSPATTTPTAASTTTPTPGVTAQAPAASPAAVAVRSNTAPPPAPANPAVAPGKSEPAAVLKPVAPAKAANSNTAPAIVRDNPF